MEEDAPEDDESIVFLQREFFALPYMRIEKKPSGGELF